MSQGTNTGPTSATPMAPPVVPLLDTAGSGELPVVVRPSTVLYSGLVADGWRTELRDRMTAVGRGCTKMLAAHVDDVQQRFAAEVIAAGRRAVSAPLDATRAEVAHLVDALQRSEVPNGVQDAPLVIHLVVRFE